MTVAEKEKLTIVAAIETLEDDLGKEQYFHWVERHWSSRGEPLDFIEHGYLKQVYEDQHPFIVVMKSAQVGMTERMVTEALWLPDQFQYNCIYFFPTTGTMGDLVQERVDQPINNSKYLQTISGRAKQSLGKHADKMGLKKMSKGFVYFRGSNALPAITSVSGDAIFVDELDRMTKENIPYFDKRLEHSKLKWQRWASTPTYPNVGIHAMYQKTDQHEYHVKCNHCGEQQLLDFFKSVDIEKRQILCIKCRKSIIPWQLKGEWLPSHPERKIRGYHISQLYSPRLDLDKLIDAHLEATEAEQQQFYNQNLGLPYEPKGDKVTVSDIEDCKGDYNMPLTEEKDTFMGVDVGKKLHYIVRTEKKVIGIGSVDEFLGSVNSLEEIIRKFKVRGTVIDALPETRKVAELIAKYKGQVKMCYYSGQSEVKDSKQYWKVDGDKVNVDRTVSLDHMVAEYKQRKIQIPKNHTAEPEFVSHMAAPIRVVEEDSKGIKKASYVEVGDDHLFHSSNYAKLAVGVFNTATPEIFVV